MLNLKNTEQCPECGRFANRGNSIDAVIVRDGKILLVKRGREPYKGFWATPGGYIDWDESAEETVKREVKEETDLDVTSVKLFNAYTDPARHPKQTMALAYIVQVKDDEPKAGDDADAVEWFDLDKLPESMAFDHRKLIADAKKHL